MVLYLILITFGVFIVFWLGDLYLTLKTVKRLGKEIELNPIIKFILRGRGRLIYAIKPIELCAFLYLLWFLTTFEGAIPFYILVLFIFLYSLIVVNNAHVYYIVTKKESFAFKLVFIGATIALLLFLYLNFVLYSDLTVSYNALAKSNDKYSQLLSQCTIKDTPLEKSTKENTVATNLNLTVPNGGGLE